MYLPRYLQLLIDSASERRITVHHQGQEHRIPVRHAALHELKRPPFILSAPTEKKVWTEEEIAEFYKTNPMLNV